MALLSLFEFRASRCVLLLGKQEKKTHRNASAAQNYLLWWVASFLLVRLWGDLALTAKKNPARTRGPSTRLLSAGLLLTIVAESRGYCVGAKPGIANNATEACLCN
jgi:hypothetical protein